MNALTTLLRSERSHLTRPASSYRQCSYKSIRFSDIRSELAQATATTTRKSDKGSGGDLIIRLQTLSSS